jgi:hypothetical protein
MDFYVSSHEDLPHLEWFFSGLRDVMVRRGHNYVDEADEASLVLNSFPRATPRLFRRRGQAVFVVGVTELGPGLKSGHEVIPEGYPLLVRSISNLLIGVTAPRDAAPDAHFITPEQG